MSGIYIHIPFCRSRCIYCGFYSTTLLDLSKRYIEAVCKEMQLRQDYIKGQFSTVYIGGGTPSLLSKYELDMLFHYIYKVFDVSNDAEITMECNPDDVTAPFAQMLSKQPVNRVSMGAQTFSNERLKLLRRRHDANETIKAVSNLRQAGIGNISIDLMFGFPDETIAEWTSDIDNALDLDVEHISAYSLMYEEGTRLATMLEKGEINEIDDELSLAMYDTLVDKLTAAGYEHYEISNFARKGFRSRHNGSYWQQKPYIGLGAAAHSFDIASRQWNVAGIKEYIEAINNGTIPTEREILTPDTTFNDIITTALRTCDGVSLDDMEAAIGKKYCNILLDNARQYIDKGLMEQCGNHIRITRKGIYISDTIMSDIMIV